MDVRQQLAAAHHANRQEEAKDNAVSIVINIAQHDMADVKAWKWQKNNIFSRKQQQQETTDNVE